MGQESMVPLRFVGQKSCPIKPMEVFAAQLSALWRTVLNFKTRLDHCSSNPNRLHGAMENVHLLCLVLITLVDIIAQ